VYRYQSLEDVTDAIVFGVASFEFKVGGPGCILRLPVHPSLKSVSSPFYVSQCLLNREVFVPRFVDVRKEGSGTIEDVSSI
jgi:hypothetical protein